MKKQFILKIQFALYVALFTTCVEPVEPEFNPITGLITVESIISNEQGSSFVRIQESELDPVFSKYINVHVNEADITFVNTHTSKIVRLIEDIEASIYLPPEDFVASVGDTWELDIKLPYGGHYKSLPETIKEPVVIESIEAEFKPELEYSNDLNQFISGHIISVSFNDPADEKNYYYWSYKSFEPKLICLVCVDSYYREGICNNFDGFYPNKEDPFYISYLCEPDCWRIRYNQKVEILDDEFINGSLISQLPVANVVLHNKKNILIELRQTSLSKSAYKYYNVLNDLAEDNSGFNAPPTSGISR